MSKKLLIISQRFWPQESDINTIAKCFANEGVKVDVLCGKPFHADGSFYEGYGAFKGSREEHFGNVNIYRAAEIKKKGFLQKRVLLNYFSFRISSSFRMGKLRNNQYDAVLVYQTSPVFQGRASLRMARRRGIRYVMYVEDLWPEALYRELDLRDWLLRRLFRAISYGNYKKADTLITGSANTARFLVREIAESPGEVKYIAPFASESFRPGERSDRIMQKYTGSFNLLYAGEFPADGSLNIFLEAAVRLVGMGIRDIRFILAGDGEGLEDLKKETDRMYLYDTVFFTGSVTDEELSGYIYAADVLICAQKKETEISYKPPKQIISCLQARKPVIAAAEGEGREIIKKAGCGIVCEMEDADSFAQAVLKLYKTPKEELKAMGERAKAYQEAQFSIRTQIHRIMDAVFDM